MPKIGLIGPTSFAMRAHRKVRDAARRPKPLSDWASEHAPNTLRTTKKTRSCHRIPNEVMPESGMIGIAFLALSAPRGTRRLPRRPKPLSAWGSKRSRNTMRTTKKTRSCHHNPLFSMPKIGMIGIASLALNAPVRSTPLSPRRPKPLNAWG